jgi:hypothetical protein
LILKTNSTGITFAGDWFGVPGNCASLSLAQDAMTNSFNLLSGGGTFSSTTPGTGKGALSCLFKVPPTNAPSSSAFIYTTPGSIGASNNFSLVLAKTNNNLQVSFGNATKTIRQGTNMVPGDWYYFALNYDETVVTNQVTWWLGQPGTTLSSGVIAAVSNALAGAGTSFVIGNSTTFGSGFRGGTGLPGQIDEFAIWHRQLTGVEVTNQFNALVALGNPSVSLPAISGISPASGATNGGTTVTITGQNFLPGATVQFGSSTPVTATYVDSATLTVVTPGSPQGTVDVKVVNTNSTSNVRNGGYFYYVPAQAAVLVSSKVDNNSVPPNLNLVWSGSANATSILLMATNLTPPVVWTPVVTNTMAADGLLTNSVPIGAEPSVFFRLQN